MRIKSPSAFIKEFKKLQTYQKKKAKKTIELFLKNPRHPSLHFKKVQGYNETPPIMELRVDIEVRITLQIFPDFIYFRHIGTHEIFRRP